MVEQHDEFIPAGARFGNSRVEAPRDALVFGKPDDPHALTAETAGLLEKLFDRGLGSVVDHDDAIDLALHRMQLLGKARRIRVERDGDATYARHAAALYPECRVRADIGNDGRAFENAAFPPLAKAISARITFLTVSKPWRLFSLDPLIAAATNERHYLEESARIAAMRLNVGEELAESKGVQAAAVHMYESEPWKAIVDQSQRVGCDLIVMASHGHRAPWRWSSAARRSRC